MSFMLRPPPPNPLKSGDFFNRHFDLLFTPEGKRRDRREDAEQTQACHPPDVPDQCEAQDHGKEGDDEAGRTAFRYFDGLISTRHHSESGTAGGVLLIDPEGVDPGDVRQDREVPGRWRRGRRPFQRSAVPGVAGDVAQQVPVAN